MSSLILDGALQRLHSLQPQLDASLDTARKAVNDTGNMDWVKYQTACDECRGLIDEWRNALAALEQAMDEVEMMGPSMSDHLTKAKLDKRLFDRLLQQAQASLRKISHDAHKLDLQSNNVARAALLAGSSKHESAGAKLKREYAQGDANATLGAANEVTQAMKRVLQSLNAEVERTSETAQVFEESSLLLRKTNREHQNYAGVMGTARHLLTRMRQRDFTDKLLMALAVAFFVLVVLYILKRRVWLPSFQGIWQFVFQSGPSSAGPGASTKISKTLKTLATAATTTALKTTLTQTVKTVETNLDKLEL